MTKWDHDETPFEIDGIMLDLIRQFKELTRQILDYPIKGIIAHVKYKTVTGNVPSTLDEGPDNHGKILEDIEAYLQDSARRRQAAVQNGLLDKAEPPTKFQQFAASAKGVCRTRKFA